MKSLSNALTLIAVERPAIETTHVQRVKVFFIYFLFWKKVIHKLGDKNGIIE